MCHVMCCVPVKMPLKNVVYWKYGFLHLSLSISVKIKNSWYNTIFIIIQFCRKKLYRKAFNIYNFSLRIISNQKMNASTYRELEGKKATRIDTLLFETIYSLICKLSLFNSILWRDCQRNLNWFPIKKVI